MITHASTEEFPTHHSGQNSTSIARIRRNWPRSIFFAINAFAFMALAGSVINIVAGGLANDNIILSSEENSARNAAVIQSIMVRWAPGGSTGPAQWTSEHFPTFEASSQLNPALLNDLDIVKLSFLNLDGETVWSSDSNAIGVGVGKPAMADFRKAADGYIASILEKNVGVADSASDTQPKSIVRTYVPIIKTV